MSFIKEPSTSFNKYGYQDLDLYKRRAAVRPGVPFLRVFQVFADHQYQGATASLINKNIVLNCTKAGGNGDVAHIFRCAELIKKHFPDSAITLLIEPSEKNDKEKVKEIFPTELYNTEILSWDYYEIEQRLIQARDEAGCMLGIAVPLGNPEIEGPLYRTLKEYGFANHPDIKRHDLGMGLDPFEEGLNFPDITHRKLSELKTPWLKQALQISSPADEDKYHQERTLYHMYMSSVWTMQLLALYTSAAVEKQNAHAFDVFVPLSYSLKELIEWGALDLNYLKRQNIGKIVCVTPQGTECIELGEGKEMRILSGSVHKNDMEAIEEHSELLFGCTGDNSWAAHFMRGKVGLYSDIGHKANMVKSWNELIKNRDNSRHLLEFQNTVDALVTIENETYTANTPKKISYYQGEPSMDLAKPDSVTRKSLGVLSPLLPHCAEKLANLYLNTPLIEEAQRFDAYIRDNFSLEPRLIAMTHRGLMLTNYPHLIQIEKHLWKQYKQGKMTETQVVEALNECLAECAHLTPAQARARISVPQKLIPEGHSLAICYDKLPHRVIPLGREQHYYSKWEIPVGMSFKFALIAPNGDIIPEKIDASRCITDNKTLFEINSLQF